MGRKSLAKERRTQILDALEVCIEKYGLQRTTLENIAVEAGINRGMIHHYIGNRSDVVQKMVARFLNRYQRSYQSFGGSRPGTGKGEILLDYFFDAWFDIAPKDDAIISELMAESERNPQFRQMLPDLYRTFETQVAQELEMAYPEASQEDCRSVAFSFMSLAYGCSTMIWLGFDRSRLPEVRSLARALLTTLET